MTQNRESTSRVRVCESRAHSVFNQSSSGFISIIWLPHLPAGTFYCLSLRKIITPQNLMCLWSKINQGQHKKKKKYFKRESKLTSCFNDQGCYFLRLHRRTINFFSSKKKQNINLYVNYSRTLLWFFENSKLTYKTAKFLRNFRQKHELQYLGISNSLCSRTV